MALRRVTVMLSEELHAAVEAEADAEHRTVGDQIYVILERMLVDGKVGPVEQVRALAALRAHLDDRFDALVRAVKAQPAQAIGFPLSRTGNIYGK